MTRCDEDISGLRALGGLVSYDPLWIEFDCNTLPEANGGEAPECFLPITLPPEKGSELNVEYLVVSPVPAMQLCIMGSYLAWFLVFVCNVCIV